MECVYLLYANRMSCIFFFFHFSRLSIHANFLWRYHGVVLLCNKVYRKILSVLVGPFGSWAKFKGDTLWILWKFLVMFVFDIFAIEIWRVLNIILVSFWGAWGGCWALLMNGLGHLSSILPVVTINRNGNGESYLSPFAALADRAAVWLIPCCKYFFRIV